MDEARLRQQAREWDNRIRDERERADAGLSKGDVLWLEYKHLYPKTYNKIVEEKECTQKQQS